MTVIDVDDVTDGEELADVRQRRLMNRLSDPTGTHKPYS